MKNILVIESSGKVEGSYSRLLVAEFVELLNAQKSDYTFTFRDLAHDPLPFLQSHTVDLIRTPSVQLSAEQQQIIQQSDQLIAELKAADFVVIGSPMYNWSISASLKAWLDQVMRVGETFTYAEGGVVGLLNQKPGLVIMSRGGSYDAPERAVVDMQRPYLQNVLGVMGLLPRYVTMEGTLMGEEICAANLANARVALQDIASQL